MKCIRRAVSRPSIALPAILLAMSCGGGSSPTESTGGPRTITVAVKDSAFEPRAVTIRPGDTVQWVLQGNDKNHTVTALNGAFDSGRAFTSSGAMFERRFTEANQTFEYSCRAHSDCCNMKGSIRVGESAPPPNPGYE